MGTPANSFYKNDKLGLKAQLIPKTGANDRFGNSKDTVTVDKMSIVYDRELSRSTHNGINSMLLIEKIVRERVFDSLYWKQYCFNINAATILDRCLELNCVGAMENSGRPFPFVCLLVKLVQLNPQRSIIEFYVSQFRFKYLKLLALVYVRLVYKDSEYLKVHLVDYRKIRLFENGVFSLTYMDECVDRLLNDKFFIGLTLPYMPIEQ